MMIESEGVMQVSVTTAQKHPLPARGIAHREALIELFSNDNVLLPQKTDRDPRFEHRKEDSTT